LPARGSIITPAILRSSPGNAEERGTADGCGSHTATLVPDLGNNRLIVYSNNSSGDNRPVCNAMDIIEVRKNRRWKAIQRVDYQLLELIVRKSH
jgi:hypothetical protein